MQEVTDQVEDRAVKDRVPCLDGLITDRLYEMALSQARRPQPENVSPLAEEPAARQSRTPACGDIDGLNDQSKSSNDFRSRNSAVAQP